MEEGKVVSVKSQEELGKVLGSADKVVINFCVTWNSPSRMMTAAIEEYAKRYPEITFVNILADENSELSIGYGVESVPVFMAFKNNKVVGKVRGANQEKFKAMVTDLNNSGAAPSSSPAPVSDAPSAEEEKKMLHQRLAKLVSYAPVMLFMKGTPSEPKCKFSRRTVAFLAEKKVNYCSFNILSDDTIRQELKVFSNWPTYPQLYVKGKLIGGLDVIKELDENDEFLSSMPPEALGKEPGKDELFARLEKLVNRAPIMLFMKGSPEAPECGFSRKMVALLKSINIQYDSFNILTDNSVRQGLKEYANWPTFPQLYHNGKLLGGLDVITELQEDGELEDLLKPKDNK